MPYPSRWMYVLSLEEELATSRRENPLTYTAASHPRTQCVSRWELFMDASACPSNINRLFHSLLQSRKVTPLTPKGRALKVRAVARPCGTS
ncbi:hypothetical protein AVEN_185963-1 [Araneus ventricosus]|uniref:Uncharacterized protein n=1 Tax=Araneus ventricosus TaxID=182803 RepID=A0A4Y2QG85_ARAVE|nr:hypothetical protein AVEN_185963-1 [Araneus ventricosus]